MYRRLLAALLLTLAVTAAQPAAAYDPPTLNGIQTCFPRCT